ncbi:MAG: hypothetical protein ABI954_06950, partial [Pyrinomonadaceae bacterium]
DNQTEQTILNHVKQNFSLAADEVSIKKIEAENLPNGVAQYYVEKKSSYGNIFYNYLIYNNQLYCSGVEKDFGKFLQDTNFLAAKNLTTAQFLQLYRVLSFKRRDINILSAEKISNPSDKIKLYAKQLAPPQLTFEDGGATLIFFGKKVAAEKVERFEIKVSPAYQVIVSNQVLEKTA